MSDLPQPVFIIFNIDKRDTLREQKNFEPDPSLFSVHSEDLTTLIQLQRDLTRKGCAISAVDIFLVAKRIELSSFLPHEKEGLAIYLKNAINKYM